MIRLGRPADGPRLCAIQRAALDEPWLDLLDAALDGPPTLLVVEDEDPVGYALAVPGDGVAYVAEVAIAPDRQGEGHGSSLLAALLDRLCGDGVDTVRLTARADDERVRSFYARFGFAVVDRVPDHYEDGDGVVMARPCNAG